jgi:hypothetical protein
MSVYLDVCLLDFRSYLALIHVIVRLSSGRATQALRHIHGKEQHVEVVLCLRQRQGHVHSDQSNACPYVHTAL